MSVNPNHIKIGDTLYIEEAWEDEAGHYHDEWVIVSRIYPDGRMRFRISDNKKRWKIQAFLNKCDYYAADYKPEPQS